VSLEEQIVEWATSRPSWQRAVLRRVALGQIPAGPDYDDIVEAVIAGKDFGDARFGLDHLPTTTKGDLPVKIIAIGQPEHINALASEKPLKFEARGITIVYGDNASGKSGYARLLKLIARARHQEDILSDVFQDTALAKQKAALTVAIGDSETTLIWPDATPGELKRMLFYDQACGAASIVTESDFPYRPSALFAMDGLIDACVAVRDRIDRKLGANALEAKSLPIVKDDLRETAIGKYLTSLTGNSTARVLDEIIAKPPSTHTVEELLAQEAQLRSGDTAAEKVNLIRQAAKLDALAGHLVSLEQALGNDAVDVLQQTKGRLKSVEDAANLLGKSFDSEPLRGVGTSPWKDLWDSARRYSEKEAYRAQSFPVLTATAKCVLCQQSLEETARERFARFQQFLQDDTQTQLSETRARFDEALTRLTGLRTIPDVIEAHLNDLETYHRHLVSEARTLLASYETAREGLVTSLPHQPDLPRSGLKSKALAERLRAAAMNARENAQRLSDPQVIQQRITQVVRARNELELLGETQKERDGILREIARRKQRDNLETAKAIAATGPITKKILELSEENITEVVRDAFTRETERLHLERVTIAKTRADKGALLHQPKLVGARQNVTLPRVFSEGERTALGLAAFFTEANLDASKSALILDDPVTSLDHIRRGLVAERLVTFAETRQVVVFTHDVALVADLKRAAKAAGVSIGERSVTRGRGDRKPGACTETHPWKAKDVAERLGQLRTDLARIKRSAGTWDESTYENEVATWAGNLSETWERIFSQEIVGQVLTDGGLEVRPQMVKVLTLFTEKDERDFQASYSRVSLWAKRHDKSSLVNYVAPTTATLEGEIGLVDEWFRRVRRYRD
jgi:hypothetical protein